MLYFVVYILTWVLLIHMPCFSYPTIDTNYSAIDEKNIQKMLNDQISWPLCIQVRMNIDIEFLCSERIYLAEWTNFSVITVLLRRKVPLTLNMEPFTECGYIYLELRPVVTLWEMYSVNFRKALVVIYLSEYQMSIRRFVPGVSRWLKYHSWTSVGGFISTAQILLTKR